MPRHFEMTPEEVWKAWFSDVFPLVFSGGVWRQERLPGFLNVKASEIGRGRLITDITEKDSKDSL
jgi:hypothetical protein